MTPFRSRRVGLLAAATLLAALLAGRPIPARAGSFQVSPTRFEFSLARRFTNFFTVTNNSGGLLRLRVSTGFLDADAKGDLKPVSGSPYDMAGWLVINPRRINLAPAEKRVVRFTVRPPAGLAPGEYRTVVFFEELPPRPGDEAQEGTGVQIQILTRLGITIYGTLGNPSAQPHVESPTVRAAANGIHFRAIASNTGNTHVTLAFKATLLDASGKTRGETEQNLVVQRDQQRRVDFRIVRPPAGDYQLHVVASAGEHPVFETELPVKVGTDAQ